MHDGSFRTLEEVIEHYNEIPNNNSNTNLDPRLSGPPGTPTNQALNLTDEEKNALVAFLKTLTGSDVYTNEKWSDPFK
jgi:cytochrome c peroxidase